MASIDRLTHVSEAPLRRNYRDNNPDLEPVVPRTEKERLFVTEFLRDLSPTNAAVRAGYKPSSAQALMARPEIQSLIGRALAERHARVGSSIERMVSELGIIAYGDPRALLNDDGTLKLPTQMDEDTARMIAGFKTRRIIELDENGNKRPVEIQEIKLVDRIKVYDMLMRHLGAYNDKLIIHHTQADRLRNAKERINGGGLVDAIEAEWEEIGDGPAEIEDQSLDDLLS